ncbi:MAG: hypothetical protein PUG48_05325 [Clostridia bacterium]|nr:hypothetical protein [Clostridia bacterium]
MGKTRKQITFDIDTNVAKQIFGDNYRKAYDDIERFFKKQNFQHIQGSVYVSKKPMYKFQLFHLIVTLTQQYPYIKKCVRDIVFGNTSKNNSLNKFFDYDGTAGQYKKYNLPLPTKNVAGNLLKRTVTIEEATELLNNKIPFNAKKIDTNVLIVFDKSLKSKIDDVITKLHQKNNIKPKR